MARRLASFRRSGGGGLIDPLVSAPRRALFIFLDGVGVGSADPTRNPLAAARMPALRSLLDGRGPFGGELGSEPVLASGSAARAIDATFGIAGLPQSGTGQTALLTGRNAPAVIGRHFGPWVPTPLRDLLAAENVFRRFLSQGLEVSLANAYPRAHYPRDILPSRRPGAIPLAAIAAGVLTRDEASLRDGDALVSSITTDSWRRHIDPGAPVVDPREAGRRLARLSSRADFTFFAHFDTDYVGHRGSLLEAATVLERVDALLEGVLEDLGSETLLIVTSDHGNIEEVKGEHTHNPVPLVAAGPASGEVVERIGRIDDVVPVIEEMLLRGRARPEMGGGGEPALPLT
ncbi:MAG TPA: alkaline phosphatase family protein [Longimicrobiaceae bacterium]|nr:alkaline phosphatase family protein [Longimicrobiaceae bacterium]